MTKDEAVCVCGDYKHDHKDGVGQCRMPDDLCHGFEPCLKYEPVGEQAKSGAEGKKNE